MTNDNEDQYLDLLAHIRHHGRDRGDRTGVGTRSVFGRQMRFDLAENFPLLTTKKMFWKGVVEELLWFLSGSTNVNDLDAVRHWWTSWAGPEGDLGPIYGRQYRNARWWDEVEPAIFGKPETQPEPSLGKHKRAPHSTPSEQEQTLKTVWREMVKRCYNESCKAYKSYGGAGVHVCDRWLNFENFLEDAVKLPGWHLKKEYPGEYSLDKDARRGSNRYGPDTCMWASEREQNANRRNSRPFTANSPDGKSVVFSSIGEAAREESLNVSAVHRCLNGGLKSHKGWRDFRYLLGPAEGKIRFRDVDQLKNLLASIKHDPMSRRLIFNLWNTPAMEHAGLPCCHGNMVQFYCEPLSLLERLENAVRIGFQEANILGEWDHDEFDSANVPRYRLSCQMYQRSGDMFLGVPVNIASYALLTTMIAAECNMIPGEFVHTLGDAHIYHNHFDAVDKQLQRTPYAGPDLEITGTDFRVLDATDSNIHLINYQSHPAIKAPVAV